MGILDELFEKKDAVTYLSLRIEEIQNKKEEIHRCLQSNELSNKEKKQIMKGLEKLYGRKAELLRLRFIVRNKMLKTESKKIWRQLNYDSSR